MKKLFALLALMPLIAQPMAAGVVQCTGANDAPAIQASLDAGGITTLAAGVVCNAPGLIYIREQAGPGNQAGETALHGGVLRSAGIVIEGARQAAIRGVEFYSSGIGLVVRSAIQVTLADNYFSTDGHCMVLESIAGVWMYGKNQCSATAQAVNSVGVMIGNSSQGFEAVDVSGLLIEGYYTCLRIGGHGNNVNMWFRGLKCDRPGMFGVLINPMGTASIRNIIFSGFFINGAQYAFALNTTETAGTIARVELIYGHVLGGQVVVGWGGNIDVREIGVVTGPLEPG